MTAIPMAAYRAPHRALRAQQGLRPQRGQRPQQGQHPQPRLRLTARGRRVLLALVVAPLVAVITAVAVNGGVATATSESTVTEYVTVEAGQSLWTVAQSIAPNDDPREVIAAIESLNGLETSAVTAGERLAIPSRYAD